MYFGGAERDRTVDLLNAIQALSQLRRLYGCGALSSGNMARARVDKVSSIWVFFDMRLPAAESAIIDGTKIRDYLLSHEHPIGTFKAKFFGALGYAKDDWQRLASDIRAMPVTQDASIGQRSAFGEKFEVRGTLLGPAGVRAPIVTVWIILAGEHAPRFVTAFPG